MSAGRNDCARQLIGLQKKAEVLMYPIIRIESAANGILMVNGCFCGPLEEGQSFPASRNAEIYMQLFPFSAAIQPLTAALRLSGGQIERLEPQESCYALLWPDGVIQLELRPIGMMESAQPESETLPGCALLKYLTLRLGGDGQASQLLLRAQDEPELDGYAAVVPLRFAPIAASERFDERAGLVRRVAPNIAVVDAALAVTVPAGQGKRLIERVEIMRGG